MAIVTDLVQEVVIAGGAVCFWVGPTRSSAQLFSFWLDGTVPEASNNGMAVALLMSSHLSGFKVRVSADEDNRVTKVESAQTGKHVTIDVSQVVDRYPYVTKGAMGDYAPRDHVHDERYSQLGHDHASAYSPVGHAHDTRYSLLTHDHAGVFALAGHNHDPAYATIGHNHNHDALISYERKEHTLAIETVANRAVPLGAPLQELTLADAEFTSLRNELGASPLAAYTSRNGMSNLAALVEDGGVITRVLGAIMVRNAAAPDLRWGVKLFLTGSEAEYTRPTLSSTEVARLIVTTQLDAAP